MRAIALAGLPKPIPIHTHIHTYVSVLKVAFRVPSKEDQAAVLFSLVNIVV